MHTGYVITQTLWSLYSLALLVFSVKQLIASLERGSFGFYLMWMLQAWMFLYMTLSHALNL